MRSDRSRRFSSKARIVILVFSILVMTVVAILVIRFQPQPKDIASTETPTKMLAASPPVGTPHADGPPPRANGIRTLEVCGYGEVPIGENDAGAIFQHVGALTKGAATHWLSALQNSGDLRARVAGLLLEGKVTGGDSLRPVDEQTRNEVVHLAAGSAEPAVYAMALSMCNSIAATDAESACRELSLQQWSRIDPDNAVPWLLLAGDARSRHDGAAEAEAFSHAATAHKIDSYSDSVYAFAEPELPPDVTQLERAYLATEVVGVEAGIRGHQYSVASQYCSSNAMQDAGVQQQCKSLAELLVTKGNNFLDLGLGKTIGARAGWPKGRVEELVLEQQALMQSIIQQAPSGDDKRWTCNAVSRANAYMIQRVRMGELAAARDGLERSGETMEEMAQKYNEYMDNLRHEALRQEQREYSDAAQ